MSSALVIGNGAAGTFSAWLLARNGWKVTLVGRGTPGTALSTGCLRSAPKVCGQEIMEFLGSDDISWTSGAREGVSRIGTQFRCWMSPSHSTWAEDEVPKSIAVAGIEGHPSLPARVASTMLNQRGIRAMPFIMSGPVPSDVPLSTLFRDDGAWEALAEQFRQMSAEAILLPSIVPLQEHRRLDHLERRCGRRILEAISPMGVAGQRLVDLMVSKAREAGVTIWDGRRVSALDAQEGKVLGATVIGGREARHIAADAFVLATGGPLVDGLVLKGREVEDPYGIFQIVHRGDPFNSGYDSANGMLVGVGGQVISNAVGAGDCLSSRERMYGSGLTEALESAYLAVRALEDE